MVLNAPRRATQPISLLEYGLTRESGKLVSVPWSSKLSGPPSAPSVLLTSNGAPPASPPGVVLAAGGAPAGGPPRHVELPARIGRGAEPAAGHHDARGLLG